MKRISRKLKNFFNKRKQKNVKKHSGKKRKFIGSAVLAGSLIFGILKSDSGKTQNYESAKALAHERLISNQELNSLEDSHNSGRIIQTGTGTGTILTFQQKTHDSSLNEQFHLLQEDDSQVILVKAGDNPVIPPTRGPSNFPVAPSRPVPGVNSYRTPPKLVDQGLGAAGNPAGGGNGGVGAAEFDDNSPVPKKEQSQESKIFDYDYRPNDPKKKKQSAEQCYEQNKAGMDELPDSSEFIYSLETKTAKKALRNVWKNPQAKKEVLAGLGKMDRGELVPRNQKYFKGFKTLKEIKLTNTRMLIQTGKNGAPDEIVAIFMRRDLDDIALNFKNKYK